MSSELRLEAPSTPRQYEQWASIVERVTGEVFAVDEVAHAVETDERSIWLLAHHGGEVAGCGVGRPSSIAGSLFAMSRVLPAHRRRGVGMALYVALSEHARSRGETSLLGRIREDDAESRRFAAARAFTEVSREHEVVLDVAEAILTGEPPAGIEVVTLAERPELERAVYELDSEVAPDVPSPEGDHDQMTFEQLAKHLSRRPGCRPGDVRHRAGGRRGRRLHGPSPERSDVSRCAQPAHSRPPALEEAGHRDGSQAGADRPGPQARHRADLYGQRRDERRHARRERSARLPAGPRSDHGQRPARYVMSRQRVSATAAEPRPTR